MLVACGRGNCVLVAGGGGHAADTCAARQSGVGPAADGEQRDDRKVRQHLRPLRTAQLLHLLRQLLSQAAALCSVCTARLLRRLLLEAVPLPALPHLLLRPERLLPETFLLPSALLLAGVVFVRDDLFQ